jgi:multidrug resistance efflux pump
MTVQAAGWLEADPFYVAATALADGVVEEVLALEGERVEAGDVVAELVKEDAELALERARGELGVAEGQLGILRADLEAARTDWENPVERERAVATAEAALAETRAELAQLPALIDVQRADLERLIEERDRARTASAGGAVSDIEVVILEKQAEAQAAMLESHIKREGILEAKAQRQEAELKAARRNFELRVSEKRALDAAEAAVQRGEAMVEQMRAQVDEAKLRLERMTIRAPISGYVQQRIKVPGDKVMLGMDGEHSAHVVHLYDPERIQVRVDVPLADVGHVFAGQASGEGRSPVLVRGECLDRPSAGSEARVWVVRNRRGDVGRIAPARVTIEAEAEPGVWRVRGDVHPGDLLAVADGSELREGQRVRVTSAGSETMEGGSL